MEISDETVTKMKSTQKKMKNWERKLRFTNFGHQQFHHTRGWRPNL